MKRILSLSIMAFAILCLSFTNVFAITGEYEKLGPLEEHKFPSKDGYFKLVPGEYGVFLSDDGKNKINLKRVYHSGTSDEFRYVDITTGEVYEAKDESNAGRITIYMVNPPLLPLGYTVNWDTPAKLVQSTFNLGLSPVYTAGGKSVPNHAIGHVFVKLEVPGLPVILTGMTTGQDAELGKDLLVQQDGLAILYESQVGRLNTAAELMEELVDRNLTNEVFTIDGRDGGKAGKIATDANYSFLTYEVNEANARGLYAFMLEYIDRGIHNHYGSLVSRPAHASGAGCIAFGISFLKAAGIIPVIGEQDLVKTINREIEKTDTVPYWATWVRELYTPAAVTGRIEVDQLKEAGLGFGIIDLGKVFGKEFNEDGKITIFDMLFSEASEKDLAEGSKALTKAAFGGVAGFLGFKDFQGFTLPSWIRNPVKRLITSDDDRARTTWVERAAMERGEALPLIFWDNALLDEWVKAEIKKIEDYDPGEDEPIWGKSIITEGAGVKGLLFDAKGINPPNSDLFQTIDAVETVNGN